MEAFDVTFWQEILQIHRIRYNLHLNYLNLKMFKWNGSKILIPMISLRDLKVDPLVVRHICPSIVINEPVKTEIENPLDVGNKYRSCDNLSRQD